MKKTTTMGSNRTGIAMSPRHGKEMIEGASKAPPGAGDGLEISRVRRTYIDEAEPIGAVPPPASLKGMAKTASQILQGHRPTVFMDKVAERLAFERTGSRLYEALISKFDAGGFHGGPTREELQRVHRQEIEHFELLRESMEALGGDPTAQTPGADIVGVESMGLMQVVTDPRTSFPQSLHATLVAELADHEGWQILCELAESLGQDEIAKRFRTALTQEQQHLAMVRRWMADLVAQEARTEMSSAPG